MLIPVCENADQDEGAYEQKMCYLPKMERLGMSARIRLFLCLLLATGCDEKEEFHPVYEVPAQLDSYVASFIAEASARGFDYKIDNLIIRYDATLSGPVCGQCNEVTKKNNVQKIITINAKLTCWTNDQELEALLFHELGHCFLGRTHLTDLLPNGDPKSIMYPDNNSLYPPCVYAVDNTSSCNKTFKRQYYLDELFNEITPAPDWAKK